MILLLSFWPIVFWILEGNDGLKLSLGVELFIMGPIIISIIIAWLMSGLPFSKFINLK